MRLVSGIAATVVVLASLACGSEAPQAHSNSYTTVMALSQVEADLGKGAIVIRPVDTSDDDPGCTINGTAFSTCTIDTESPPDLHVQSTLCELHPDNGSGTIGGSEARMFVECRGAGAGILPPQEIPHCPGHAVGGVPMP